MRRPAAGCRPRLSGGGSWAGIGIVCNCRNTAPRMIASPVGTAMTLRTVVTRSTPDVWYYRYSRRGNPSRVSMSVSSARTRSNSAAFRVGLRGSNARFHFLVPGARYRAGRAVGLAPAWPVPRVFFQGPENTGALPRLSLVPVRACSARPTSRSFPALPPESACVPPERGLRRGLCAHTVSCVAVLMPAVPIAVAPAKRRTRTRTSQSAWPAWRRCPRSSAPSWGARAGNRQCQGISRTWCELWPWGWW
jgi:hypothetical protein